MAHMDMPRPTEPAAEPGKMPFQPAPEDTIVVAPPAAATFLERILADAEIVIVTKRGAPIAVVLSPARAGRLDEQLADAQIAELLPPLAGGAS